MTSIGLDVSQLGREMKISDFECDFLLFWFNFKKSGLKFSDFSNFTLTSKANNFFTRWDEDLAIIFMLTSDRKLSKNEVSADLKFRKSRPVLKG